ncbi:50S ribosomal protein L18 [Anatilimnocola aggregata]|uniref:Large ribosomal subunit protein uL18 n=1 Tax=Anatilimnocola aggregata TaxID=2528021 RepID=A0A517YJQ8_9BACT|nr:50S ribosomal protein L18 [Anatilimnocola aggregata]QDU30461.1 50S ribosomal protein L18 [Anatilimnocola aggregata]
MDKQRTLGGRRVRRSFRVRKKFGHGAERPRLSINRSHKNLAVQIIDDSTGQTLVSASTIDKDLRSEIKYGGNKEAAIKLGKIIAERAIAKGIKEVAFDRGHLRYHGRVASLADAAREGGLSF